MGSYLTFEHYYGEPKVFVTTEPFPMYEDEEPQRGQTMFALEKYKQNDG